MSVPHYASADTPIVGAKNKNLTVEKKQYRISITRLHPGVARLFRASTVHRKSTKFTVAPNEQTDPYTAGRANKQHFMTSCNFNFPEKGDVSKMRRGATSQLRSSSSSLSEAADASASSLSSEYETQDGTITRCGFKKEWRWLSTCV